MVIFIPRKSAEIEILTKIRISPSEKREKISEKKVFAKTFNFLFYEYILFPTSQSFVAQLLVYHPQSRFSSKKNINFAPKLSFIRASCTDRTGGRPLDNMVANSDAQRRCALVAALNRIAMKLLGPKRSSKPRC